MIIENKDVTAPERVLQLNIIVYGNIIVYVSQLELLYQVPLL